MAALCIGLTGGVASGKSTVASAFSALGIPVIDADQVARDVVAPGSAGLQQVVAHFGSDCLNAEGGLDRTRMRQKVFADPTQRRALESILHPLIRADLIAWREALLPPYGILMVPILIEGGFDQICDRILVVDVAEDTQIERLCQRDGVDRSLAQQMLAAQASRSQRLARADDVLLNDGPEDQIPAQVEALHSRYLSLATERT
ncbi:MAG: dephospho-CoA kinase [Oceanococcaceae bacterium]